MGILQLWNEWKQLAAFQIWPMVVIPFAIGTSLAAAEGILMPRATLYALIALFFIGISTNALRYTWADRKAVVHGLDKSQKLHTRPRTIASVFSILAAIIILLPVLYYRAALAPLTVAGILAASLGLRIPMRPSLLKDTLLLFTFGPMLVNGSYYMQTGSVSHAPALLSIPMGLLAMNTLHVRRIQNETRSNQNTAPPGRNQYLAYLGIFVMAFLALLLTAIELDRNWFLLPLTTILLLPSHLKQARAVFWGNVPDLKTALTTDRLFVLFGMLLCISTFL